MIDFACKKLNINEVIKCSLGLTKAEFEIFSFLINNKEEFSSYEISERKRLELSTVQRTLKKLVDKGIISRRQINLSNGGYSFIYSVKDRKIIREKILFIIKDWNNKVEKELKVW